MRSGRSSHTDTIERKGEERSREEGRGKAGGGEGRKSKTNKNKKKGGEEAVWILNEKTGEEICGYAHFGCT